MRKYNACDPAAARELVRTDSIRRHCRPLLLRILEVQDGWEEARGNKDMDARGDRPAE